MLNILYALESVILLVFNIIIVKRNRDKKLKCVLISAMSIIMCCVFTLIKAKVGIYDFLVMLMIAALNVITVYDINTKYIPDVLLIILNVFGLITSFFIPNGMFLTSIMGAWVITGLCFLVGRKTKGGIGTGDLFCMSGLMMSMNFSSMMNFMFSALFISVIYGVIGLIAKKKSLKSEIAFAPFLLCGYIIAILCG